MPEPLVRLRLLPLGQTIEIPRGAPLRELLFACGVEFPCGGRGACRRCRIRVVEGELPATIEEAALLTAKELREGWRLACHARAGSPATLEIAQWEAAILADDSPFEFTPAEGLGVALDLGTTTIAAQLVDLASGRVLAVRTGLNPQAAYGGDIMSRVHFALEPGGAATLERLARAGAGRLVEDLGAAAAVERIVVVGNAVMHHLFCGIDVAPLSHAPFEPVRAGEERFRASELGWRVEGDPEVRFLGCLGGFVGSDILAGILATNMHRSPALIGLIDLGTNAEVVFGSRDGVACASAAAGPAFEAGRISVGMRAATGAICEVVVERGSLRSRTIGDAPPRGICGSGLVDAVACGLELGAIEPSGRLSGGERTFAVAPAVALTQADLRELQLAKAAVAAGVEIVLEKLGARAWEVERVYLAGAFGNYINRTSARRIGLIGFAEEMVRPAGNTALLGAKMALFAPPSDLEPVRAMTRHIPLAADPGFEEIYVGRMAFPPF